MKRENREWVNEMLAYAPGITLVLFGILVLLFPYLLVAIISSLLILTGILILIWTYKVRQIKKGLSYFWEPEFWFREW